MAKAPAVKWTREHLLIALNLYCKLPFGNFDRKNAVVKDVAMRLGRSPSSLAMKLSNFASLDPVHRARRVGGLAHASRLDQVMWSEFQENISLLGEQSEEMLHNLFTKDETKEVDFLERGKIQVVQPTGPTEVMANVKVRRGQQFFRQAVINAYGVQCCISGINVPRLLIASHIKPWSKSPIERLNPKNGLCLSVLHDAAFDAGLITLNDNLEVVLSTRLRSFFPQSALEQNFLPFEGKPIQMPEKLAEPDSDFVRFHREKIFLFA